MSTMRTEQQTQQRKVFALFLVVLLLFMYKQTVWDPYFYGPLEQQQQGVPQTAIQGEAPLVAPQPAPTTTPAATNSELPAPTPAAPAPPPVSTSPYPSDAELAAASSVRVKTNISEVELSLLGGRLKSLKLLAHRKGMEKDSGLLELIEHVEGNPYPLGLYSGTSQDARVLYRLVQGANVAENVPELIDASTGESTTIILSGNFPDGRAVRKTFVFYPDSHFIDLQILLSRPPAAGTRLELEWPVLVPEDDQSLLDPYNVKSYAWFDGQKANRQAFIDVEGDSTEFGNVEWLSLGDKYFTKTMLSPNGLARARALQAGQLQAARLSGGDVTGKFRIFVGPKSYDLLEQAGYGLERNIDFGWAGFVSAPLLFMLHFFYSIFGNYGLAIVALTIVVKAVLYPLNTTSFVQMKAMQDLAPELKRIREQVKDRQEQQMQQMALYKKEGVNPLGGCLPILVQMPIFIGLYSALLVAVELRHAHFCFWIQDLSSTERLMLGNFGVPVMVILMVISMMVQQWTTPSTADPVQKKVMMFMPIIFGFMFANFPAGLTLYWLTSNLISIAQMRTLQVGKGKPAAMKITAITSVGLLLFAWVLVLLG